MSDFYKMIETPLDRAVESAINEANQRFLEDPEAQRIAQENGDRWRAIHEAEEAAGRHGVVLPLATAQAILAALQGHPNALDDFSPGLTGKMLADAIKKTEDR